MENLNHLFYSESDVFADIAINAEKDLSSISNSYRGNKRKLFKHFAKIMHDYKICDSANNGIALDLFSGSGYMGFLLKRMGYAVWCNDFLSSSYLNAVSLVENPGFMPTNEEISFVLNNIYENIDIYLQDKYKSKFTLDEQKKLVSFICNIENILGQSVSDIISQEGRQCISKVSSLGEKSIDVSSLRSFYIYSMILCAINHCVMSHCDVGGRLNKGEIIAKLDHRLNHARNKGEEMRFSNLKIFQKSFDIGRKCLATNEDVYKVLEYENRPNIDLVYIDPPYGGEQSDYADMYNFFEDYLKIKSTEKPKKFVNKKEYANDFDLLLKKLPQEADWVFSYNNSSWTDIDQIIDYIKRYRSSIFVEDVNYKYNYRSTNNVNDAKSTEYFIIARRSHV